jgi:predicted lipoprotein with Yx(FWY)xxD motif
VKKLIIALSLASLAAACGGDEGEAPEGGRSPEPPSPEMTSPAPAEAGATVDVAESELGTILVDAEGQTLYAFLNDSGGESTCYDECAANWPALEADGEPQSGAGVDASLLGTTEREDGTSQVTYNQRPLYYFAADEAPGDNNGQGVGDVWYVVSPEGEPIQA